MFCRTNFLVCTFAVCTTVSAQEPAKPVRAVVESPPAAMAPVENPGAPAMSHPRTTLWITGEPTNEEQYYLELMNRARANPTAEGARLAATTDPDVQQSYAYFGVNLATMQSEMSALVVAPPLAMNAKLLQSARDHSSDQYVNAFQGHTGSNGSDIAGRLAQVGYSASYYAENVYAYSKSTWFGHAGFEVDWGSGAGGMQSGRGHRAIIHAGFREVGVGIRNGSNGGVGPQVVTQDFGVPAGTATPFVTGVAFYDFDGDGFYDPGEGIGGIRVDVAGSAHHAVTAASGGYAVPVPPGAAQRTVTFSGAGFNATATANLNSTNNNTKVDFKPAYTPPAVNGPASAVNGAASPYQLSVTGGASVYEWRAVRNTAAAFDAAADLSRVNATTYAVITSGAYQMVMPTGQTQSVTYKAPLRGGAAPSIQFQSRLAAAMTSQRALVQVSLDNGASWTTLDSQNGTSSNGQAAFSARTVSLASVAGRDFLLRFAFSLAGTSYYNGSNASFGWHVDSVTFTDIVDTAGAVITPISGGNRDFSFTPSATGVWLLSGRAVVSGRSLDFGSVLEVNAQAAGAKFAGWALDYETSAGLPPGTISGAPAADYNHDGIANLMAYALSLSPVNHGTSGLPLTTVSGGTLRLEYTRRTDRTDVSLVPQVSVDGVNWFSPGQAGAPAGFADSVVSTSGTGETRRASVPVAGGHRYLRLKVSKL